MTTQPNKNPKHNLVQLWTAVALTVFGMLLLVAGLCIPPCGLIDSSVLVAYGEVSTFAGALFGVDYFYRHKQKD